VTISPPFVWRNCRKRHKTWRPRSLRVRIIKSAPLLSI